MNYCIVYISSAHGMSPEELESLLVRSREKNQQLDITGVLLYCNGSIIQALEGEEAQVVNLYDKIRTDPRHKRILKLYEGNVKSRSFDDWSMGYRTLTNVEMASLSEKLPAINDPRTEFKSDSIVLSLVNTFYRNNYRN